MKPTNQLLLSAAFKAYSNDRNEAPTGYERIGNPIENSFGLFATIYKQKNVDNYILSFRGTEAINTWEGFKDWSNNFNDGWLQYKEDRTLIAETIDKLLANDPNATVHLVGHSLGGALAQFAAYDTKVRRKADAKPRFTLTTWNALGGEWGLSANIKDYNRDLLKNIDGTHFFRFDDLVARLGGNHVGGKKIMLIDPEFKMESVYKAHMDEELKQALEKGTWQERDPFYAHATLLARKHLGVTIRAIVNQFDDDIEGTGHADYVKSMKLFVATGFGVQTVAQLLGFLFVYGYQRLVDLSLRGKEQFKENLIEAFEVISRDMPESERLVNLMLNSVLRQVLDVNTTHQNPNRETLQWLSQLFDEMAGCLDKNTNPLWQILKQVSRGLLNPFPGLPLGMGDMILALDKNQLSYERGLRIFLEKIQRDLNLVEYRLDHSPLILDLDGDGIETTGFESCIYFDHDNNGFAELTGWILPDDGLLGVDRNQNGVLDSGAELFGNFTPLKTGQLANDGFAALAEFDGDKDQAITTQDAIWNDLRIWQDFNQNGMSEPGELSPLASHGVNSLSLAYKYSNQIDFYNNNHRETSLFKREDGTFSDLVDVWFAVDHADTQNLHILAPREDLSPIPDLEGSGIVPSLHQAIMRDRTGNLEQLVRSWYQASFAEQKELIVPLLFQWAAVAHLPSRIEVFGVDERKLATLEAFTGRTLSTRRVIQTDPFKTDIYYLFKTLCDDVMGQLNAHSLLGEMLSRVHLQWNSREQKPAWDTQPLLAFLHEKLKGDFTAIDLANLRLVFNSLGETGKSLLGELEQQVLSSPRDQDLLLRWLVSREVTLGSSASERLFSQSSFSQSVYAGDGNDHVITLRGNDLIDGGNGDDILDGNVGSDIFLFRKSFGKDHIFEAETHGFGFDTAVFLDHTSGNLERISQEKGSLILTFQDGNSLTVDRYASEAYLAERIDQLRFADGIVWGQADILARIERSDPSRYDDILTAPSSAAADKSVPMDGLAGNDLIWGGTKNDQLHGNFGNDALYGGAGDDWLRGGRGRDLLIGGSGQDRYLYAKADGEDTIRWAGEDNTQSQDILLFDAGVLPSKVTLTREYHTLNTLVVKTGILNDKIKVEGFFKDDTPFHGRNPIGSIQFSDGTVWSTQELLERAMLGTSKDDNLTGSRHNDFLHGYDGNDSISGGSGDDYLHGNGGNDYLRGDAGNDTLYGGAGHNTFLFYPGHGQDSIAAELAAAPSERQGVIDFGAEIPLAEIDFQRRGNQLVMTRMNSDDSITVEEFFRDNDPANLWNPISTITFQHDLASLMASEIPSRLSNARMGSAGDDTLSASPQIASLYGGAGDDLLLASAGNDLLDGGAGVDTASYASSQGGVVVDLSLATPQDTQGAGVDTLLAIEHVIGSPQGDHLVGSALANRLDGGDGDDVLVSSGGADIHRGGPGADLFLYRTAQEVGHTVRGRDRILDFQSDDRIDLSRIDANASHPGDQAFVWIGDREFSAPGQLRYTVAGGMGLLKGNQLGANGPEFTLVLEGGFRLDPNIHLLL